MQVDIYISERKGSREIRIPWLPESIKYNIGEVVFATYEIMNRGPVSVPTGVELASYSWSSIFPGEYRSDTAMLRGSWKAPKDYQSILEDWRTNGTALRLMVTGYPINADVHLKEFTAEASGAFGDLVYEIGFIEDRELEITSTKNQSTGTSKNRPETQSSTTTYTIKSGDTLWTIAEKLLGSGARWRELYSANQDIIQSTARKRWKAAGIDRDSQNGHWIFPGTKINIPGNKGASSTYPASGNKTTVPGGGPATNNRVNMVM